MKLQRIEKVLALMKQLELQRLVVLHNGVHSFLEANPVYFLTGFKALGENMIILDDDGTITLAITPMWDAKRASPSVATHIIAANNLIEMLKSWIQDSTRSIGFVGIHNFNMGFVRTVMSWMKDDPRIVDAAFYEVTVAKDEEEIERAKKATWIAERAYERILEYIKPGLYEYEVAAELQYLIKSLGADDNFQLLSASQHNRAVRAPGRRRLEMGDILLAEISPSYEGQFTQICRTICVGPTNEKFIDKYQLLIHCMNRGMTAAVPGARMSDVVRAMNEPLEQQGYAQYCYPPFMRVRGHGLGVGSILPGDVSVDNDTVLQEGMLFVLHPNQYLPETGYLLCGEPVIITSSGAQPLTKRTPALDIVCC